MVSRALGQLTQKHVCEHPYNAYMYSQTCTHGDRHTEAHVGTDTRIHAGSHTQAYIHRETRMRHPAPRHRRARVYTQTQRHNYACTHPQTHTHTREQTRTFTCPLNPQSSLEPGGRRGAGACWVLAPTHPSPPLQPGGGGDVCSLCSGGRPPSCSAPVARCLCDQLPGLGSLREPSGGSLFLPGHRLSPGVSASSGSWGCLQAEEGRGPSQGEGVPEHRPASRR